MGRNVACDVPQIKNMCLRTVMEWKGSIVGSDAHWNTCVFLVESSGKTLGRLRTDGRKVAFRGRREACRGTVPSSFLNSSFVFFGKSSEIYAYKLYYRLFRAFPHEIDYAMIDLPDVICSVIATAVFIIYTYMYLLLSASTLRELLLDLLPP